MKMQQIVTDLKTTTNGWWCPTSELESYGQLNALLCGMRVSNMTTFSGTQPFALGVIGKDIAPIHCCETDRPMYAVGVITKSICDSVAGKSVGSGAE